MMSGLQFLINSFKSGGSFVGYEIIKNNLKIGDLIEIPRGKHTHWVIFERIDRHGNVWCFHVTGVPQNETDITNEVASNVEASLKYEPLLYILRDDEMSKPSECRVNNQQTMAKEMLKISLSQKPDIRQIFEMLHTLKDSVVRYNHKNSNCEHYVTFFKYGIGWSSQVNTFTEITRAVLKGMALLSGTAGTLLATSGNPIVGGIIIAISKTAHEEGDKFISNVKTTLEDLVVIRGPNYNKSNSDFKSSLVKYYSKKTMLYIAIVILIIVLYFIIFSDFGSKIIVYKKKRKSS